MEKALVIAALAALAHDTRLEVFRLLVQAGPAGLAAGQLGVHLGLASPTLSFHLNDLRHAGLVTSRRVGRSVIYMARYETMNGVMAYLTENCCGGNLAACHVPAACEPATEAAISPHKACL